MPTMNRGDKNRLELLPTIPVGATLTLKADEAHGRVYDLDTAAGSILILPPALGIGTVIAARVKTLATSNSHVVKVGNSTDVMRGGVVIADTDTSGAASSFFAGATDDTITLNRSTTGSVSLGEFLEFVDVAAGVWQVRSALISGTGTVATPFSATV